MRNHKDTPGERQPDGDVPQLVDRVRRVRDSGRQWVIEDGAGLVEINAVLLEVCGSLLGIPLEDHAGSLRYRSDWLGLPNTAFSCGAGARRMASTRRPRPFCARAAARGAVGCIRLLASAVVSGAAPTRRRALVSF